LSLNQEGFREMMRLFLRNIWGCPIALSACLAATFLLAACGEGNGDRADGSLEDGAYVNDASVLGDGGLPADAALSVESFDVLVVGAGSGGVSAAIQASRMGARVVLLEETDWVGGQMTGAAVSTMDWYGRAPAGTGLYAEFIERVRDYYADPVRFPPSGKSFSTCYHSSTRQCFEPHVGREILEQMLAEAGVDVRLRWRVTEVLRDGNLVKGVDTDQGVQLRCSILIDATEYGDVIPLTGARYRVGRSTSDAVDPAACIQDITYVAVIRRYPGGVPAALRIDTPPPGYDAQLEQEFATVVSIDGSQEIGGGYPVNWPFHNAYRGLPDSKNPLSYTGDQYAAITRTGINWANDYPGHYKDNSAYPSVNVWRDPLSVQYLEDRDLRHTLDCEAKLMTLRFLYYAQHELDASDWSVADDDGFDTPYNVEENDCENIPATLKPLEHLMPVMAYVRESRRIQALRMLTTSDLVRGTTPGDPAVENMSSSIAVGDFSTDLHNCRQASMVDFGETWENDRVVGGTAFQVPMETLIPETVDGFLAAEKNIGTSRLVSGAIRLQPITMATGQAAGALAAVAVRQAIQPREVRPIDVQVELLSSGCALARFDFQDVDEADPRWLGVELASVYDLMFGTRVAPFHYDFHPDDPVRRVDAAVILGRLFGLDVSSPPVVPTFSDVSPGTYPEAYPYVEAFYAAGFTAGCASDPARFCPEDLTTRVQMAVFLVKGLGLDLDTAPTTPFFDDVDASDPLFQYVQIAAQQGLLQGCTAASFCGDAAITRGETAEAAAAVLLRP